MHDHKKELDRARALLPRDEQLSDLADLFKLFGDTTRMKILFSLAEGELCVCALAELIGMEQSAVSHQLKKLRGANLVLARREGKTVLYRLADAHVRDVIAVGFAHLTEGEGRK